MTSLRTSLNGSVMPRVAEIYGWDGDRKASLAAGSRPLSHRCRAELN